MPVVCRDRDGNDLVVGDRVEVLDNDGRPHRVRITGYHSQPVHHNDGTDEYQIVDIEAYSENGREIGYVSTQRCRKLD